MRGVRWRRYGDNLITRSTHWISHSETSITLRFKGTLFRAQGPNERIWIGVVIRFCTALTLGVLSSSVREIPPNGRSIRTIPFKCAAIENSKASVLVADYPFATPTELPNELGTNRPQAY
jgi:hypothetical protein